MVDGAGLENQCRVYLTGGSNPSPSVFLFIMGFEVDLSAALRQKKRRRQATKEAAIAAG